MDKGNADASAKAHVRLVDLVKGPRVGNVQFFPRRKPKAYGPNLRLLYISLNLGP